MSRLFRNDKEIYLSREHTDCLKGLLAVVVIFSHIRGQLTVLNDTLIGQILTAAGYLCVGIFFFISGYGLQFSYAKNKEKYLSQFFRHRILPFYCSYLFVILVYVIFYAITGDTQQLGVSKILASLTFGSTIVQNGWYIQAILLFYLVFWLSYLLFKRSRFRLLSIVCCLAVYCVVCILRGQGPYSYVSVFCFPLGIVWCIGKKWIDKFLGNGKHYLPALLMTGFLFLLTLLLGNYPILPEAGMLLVRGASSLIFAVLVFLVLMRIRISSGLTRFLGKISFELYAFHGIFLLLFKQYLPIQNPFLYSLAVLACSIVSAFLLHPVMQFISSRVRNFGKKSP